MSRDRKQDALECKNRGNACLTSKDYDGAIDNYTEAIKLDPDENVYYSNRSAAYLSKGFHDSALKDAEQCIKLKPNWAKGYSRKGAALHAANKMQQAAQAYEEGLRACPGDAMLESALNDVNEAMKPKPASNYSGDDGGGANEMFSGLFGPDMFQKLEASPTTRDFLKDPSFVNTLNSIRGNPNTLGSYLKDPRVMQAFQVLLSPLGASIPTNDEDDEMDGKRNEEEEAKRFTPSSTRAEEKKESPKKPVPVVETEEEKAIRATKESAAAFKNQGNELYKSKKLEEAIEMYKKAAATDPTDATFYSNMSAAYLEQGAFEKCVSTSLEAIDIAKANMKDSNEIAGFIAKMYARIGNSHLKQNDYPGAIKAYETAQMESYTDEVHKRLNATKKKKAEADRLAYLSPEEGLKAKERGNEAFKQGLWADAVKEYDDAITRDPKNAVYYCNRAAAFAKLMEFGRGIADCEKSIALDPKYVKAWARKGDIEFFLKKYHRSLESYDIGLEIDPTNAQCLEGKQRTNEQIQECFRSGKSDPERAKRAMEDPEIQALLSDPIVNNVLRTMKENPSEGAKAMQDPTIAAKISSLIAAGVLSMG